MAEQYRQATIFELVESAPQTAEEEAPPTAEAGAAVEPEETAEKPNRIPRGPYTVEDFQAYRERLLAGKVTAEEHKQELARLLAKREHFVSALVSEHNADALKRMARRLGEWDWRSNTKEKNACAIHHRLAQSFVVTDSFQWSPTEESYEDALTRIVAQVTDAELAAYVVQQVAIEERREQAQAERTARNEKALENPETVEEFEIFVRRHADGERGLSPEQLETFDRLRAEQSRAARRDSKQSATVERIEADDGVQMTLTETEHTRDKHALFVVQLSSRVPTDKFREIRGKAKQLSGWYSRFARGGAVPGFQFRSKENAEAFMSLLGGDVDRSGVLEERRRRKELSAGGRLLSLADSLEEKAREELGADRLENTVRRAGMAAGIRGRARADIALAENTRQIGQALEAGTAVFLDGVRNRAQVSLLVGTLRRAVYARERKEREGKEHNPWETWTEPGDEIRSTTADIPFLEYPYPVIHASCLSRTIAQARNRSGMKMRADRMAKRLEGLDEYALVPFEEERDIDELLEFIGKAKDKRVDTEWIERGVENFKRMRAANIHTLPELRSAARELLPILAAPEEENPIKAAERELIGRDIPGFFPTPPAVIHQILSLAEIEPGHRVLEPSCGKGDIMDAVSREHPEAQLTGIEFSSSLLDILEAKGHEVSQGDFLEASGDYDRVVMNPPFECGADIDHVRHAYERLAPGGRVVAIMSEGPFFREDHKSRAFRTWLEEKGGTSEKLPDGSFTGNDAFRQTGVSTRIVTIERPRE